MNHKTPKEWGNIYQSQMGTYDDFRKRLEYLIETLIKDNGIHVAQITSRTKDVGSFIGKISRKDYNNPLDRTTDLIGIRIIVFHLDDLSKISELIEKEFLIDYEN